jgi:Family of unknown function (DUF6152)
MRDMFKSSFFVVLAVLIWSSALPAHHGAAGQDMTKLTTVKGTVTDFQFINPHVLLYLDVKDETGKIEKWVGELNGPNEMTRQHMNKNTLKAGDQITVVGNRSKNGSNFLRVHSFVTPNGQEFVLARGVDYLPKESDK